MRLIGRRHDLPWEVWFRMTRRGERTREHAKIVGALRTRKTPRALRVSRKAPDVESAIQIEEITQLSPVSPGDRPRAMTHPRRAGSDSIAPAASAEGVGNAGKRTSLFRNTNYAGWAFAVRVHTMTGWLLPMRRPTDTCPVAAFPRRSVGRLATGPRARQPVKRFNQAAWRSSSTKAPRVASCRGPVGWRADEDWRRGSIG